MILMMLACELSVLNRIDSLPSTQSGRVEFSGNLVNEQASVYIDHYCLGKNITLSGGVRLLVPSCMPSKYSGNQKTEVPG